MQKQLDCQLPGHSLKATPQSVTGTLQGSDGLWNHRTEMELLGTDVSKASVRSVSWQREPEILTHLEPHLPAATPPSRNSQAPLREGLTLPGDGQHPHGKSGALTLSQLMFHTAG